MVFILSMWPNRGTINQLGVLQLSESGSNLALAASPPKQWIPHRRGLVNVNGRVNSMIKYMHIYTNINIQLSCFSLAFVVVFFFFLAFSCSNEILIGYQYVKQTNYKILLMNICNLSSVMISAYGKNQSVRPNSSDKYRHLKSDVVMKIAFFKYALTSYYFCFIWLTL